MVPDATTVMNVSKPKTGTTSGRRQKTTHPTSTLLTSPITAAKRKKAKNQHDDSASDENTRCIASNVLDESDNDDFGPISNTNRGRQLQRDNHNQLGPPITTDDRMKDLDDLHADMVEQFVGEAKKVEERIQNSKGLRRALFSVQDFRKMAINWTVTTKAMRDIGIDSDKVNEFGAKFIPLLKKAKAHYDEVMEPEEQLDLDPNHANVINLVSDDEDDDEGNDDDVEDDDESDVTEGSHYFASKAVQAWNAQKEGLEFEKPSLRTHIESAPTKTSKKGGARKYARARGSGRRTSTSNSAPTSRSKGGPSSAGVSKRRKSWGSRKVSNPSSNAAARGKNIMAQFGRGGGSGSGSGSGGIGMMPT